MRLVRTTRATCVAFLFVAACSDSPSRDPDSSHVPVCGNGVVEPGEACDDGNTIDDLSCSADCRSYCGDGSLDEGLGEECDGNDFGGLTCDDFGFGSGTLYCQTCSIDSGDCEPSCGDGRCQPGEYPMCVEDCAVGTIGTGNGVTCAFLVDGSAQCWGVNYYGEFGNGTDDNLSNIPVPSLLADGLALPGTAGMGYSVGCSLLVDGAAQCWGINEVGQLGSGDTVDSNVPVDVVGASDYSRLSVGIGHACAIDVGSDVHCWGTNGTGQLAQPLSVPFADQPVQVTLGLPSTSIGAGSGHTCTALSDGSAYCWGDNEYGQLGNGLAGTQHSSDIPVGVLGVDDAIAVGAGADASCALRGDGTVCCWGNNFMGQLGDGSNNDSPEPVDVVGLTNIQEISVGVFSACALSSDGFVSCWGEGGSGNLGNGQFLDSNVPVDVINLSGVVEISASGSHVCAVLDDGTPRCWGNNSVGQLGNGSTVSVAQPVEPLIQ